MECSAAPLAGTSLLLIEVVAKIERKIQTHNLLTMRLVLYLCAKTATQKEKP